MAIVAAVSLADYCMKEGDVFVRALHNGDGDGDIGKAESENLFGALNVWGYAEGHSTDGSKAQTGCPGSL